MARNLMRAVAVMAALGSAAFAQAPQGRSDSPHLLTPVGMSAMVGGGTFNYVENNANAATQMGGSWTARLQVGTRSMLGGEVGYVGTAQPINALGLDGGAMLLGNGVEGAVRVNLLSGAVQPYALVGVAWKYLSIQNAAYNTSSILDNDHLFEIPAAVGVAYRYSRFVADLRLGYRAALQTQLIPRGNLSAWDAGLRVGVEF